MPQDTRARLQLERNAVHVWVAFPDEITDASLYKAYSNLMTAKERERGRRYRFARHRRQFVLTRALVRTTLSRYSKVEPHEWRFVQNQYGRPSIQTSQNHLGLKFNLAHTNGLVACAVIRDASGDNRMVGVDVENTARRGATVEIAKRYFSDREIADLRQTPEAKQRKRFFEYWTLKEAYIKARGMGLAIPLKQFSFHIRSQVPLSIAFTSELYDDPRAWRFWLIRPTPQHGAALALRSESVPFGRLVLRKTTPLMAEEMFECVMRS